MLYYLIGFWATELERVGLGMIVDLSRSIMFRAAAGSLTAFVFCVWQGPRVIAWLGKRFREPISGNSVRLVELQEKKRNTPTMGGSLVLVALLIATLIWGNPFNGFVFLGLVLVMGLAGLGAVDDLTKLSGKRRGLSEREKLIGQLALGLAVGFSLYLGVHETPYGTKLALPIWTSYLPMGWLFVPWVTLVIAASSNGVNFADGLDGLASGCWVFAGLAVGVLDYIGGHAGLATYLSVPYVPGCGELTVLVGAAVGATLGFLWFNCHPAEVFMGDTGSLGLGGLLGYAALVPRQELLLAIAGGVFVAETASVLVQRYYFRATGRRVFLCAPLHHHYQFLGWPESKIVVRFWIAAALLSILAVATLKLR
jgi:phospho-N-acetylmuramoyl-pentapeptide-transferase